MKSKFKVMSTLEVKLILKVKYRLKIKYASTLTFLKIELDELKCQATYLRTQLKDFLTYLAKDGQHKVE